MRSLGLIHLITLYPLTKISPLFPSRWPLETTILLSASRSLTILDSTCKRDHAVLIFLCLSYFISIMFSDSFMLLKMAGFLSFLRLNYIYLTFFFNPFIHRYLGCFHILAIANSAAMEMGMQKSFWAADFISLGSTPRRGIARSYGSSTFNCLENHPTVFLRGSTNLHPTSTVQGVPFLHTLTNICR